MTVYSAPPRNSSEQCVNLLIQPPALRQVVKHCNFLKIRERCRDARLGENSIHIFGRSKSIFYFSFISILVRGKVLSHGREECSNLSPLQEGLLCRNHLCSGYNTLKIFCHYFINNKTLSYNDLTFSMECM